MRRAITYLALLAFSLGVLSSQAQYFIENKGQWEEPFDYKITFKNAAVFIDESGLMMNLRDPLAYRHFHDEHGRHELPEGPIKHHGISVDFQANSNAKIRPTGIQETYHNYYLGKNKERWKSHVSIYQGLVLEDLYKGIDMVMKPGPANLKYDLIVSPGADIGQIRFTYDGAEELFLSNGRLVIKTSIGRVVEEKPIAWQKVDGRVTNVPIEFVLEGNQVGFDIGEYDDDFELIIDPNFIFSTYTGSSADNFGYTATFDTDGNTYGGGIVFGFGYPTVGAFQDSLKGGLFDASISKFSANGDTLIYSTYLGGNSNDQPHSMVVDTAGNLYVLGVTGSSDFPVTPTAYDTSFNGGPNASVGWAPFTNGVDLFITKFSANGASLVGSTYLGGTSTDGSNQQLQMNYGDAARGEVITDLTGNVYFATSTGSLDFPTAGSSVYQDSLNGGQEAVLGRFNTNLTSLEWSTYLGGGVHDAAYSIKLNSTEASAFVVGGTNSSDFPVSTNAYQTQRAGKFEGWVASFDATNGTYIASTYNGTPENDQNFFIDIDQDDELYLFGQTEGNYPITPGLWGISDGTQFLHKMNPNLQQSIQSLLFGSGGGAIGSREVNISPTALMVDDCKSVYISGWGGNTNFDGSTNGLPVTPDAIDTVTDGSDFYFMVLDGSWKFLEYATFFGGNGSSEHVDGGTSRFSPDGIIHQAVCAGCGGTSLFPAFPSNVVSTTNNSSNCNMACLRVDFDLRGAKTDIDIVPDSVCSPYQLTYTDSSSNVDLFYWDFGDGTSYIGNNPQKTYDSAGVFTVTIVGIDTLCNTSDTNVRTLFVFESLAQADFTAQWDTCSKPLMVTLTNLSTNTSTYFWDFGDGTSSTLPAPNKIYGQVGTYTIKLAVKDDFCDTWDTTSTTVEFKNSGGSIEFEMDYEPCIDAATAKFTPLASGYQIYDWDFGDGETSSQLAPSHSYSQPGTYTVTLQTFDTICGETRTISNQITIIEYEQFDELLPNVFTPNDDGNNDFWKVVDDLPASQFTEFKIEVYNRWGTLIYTTYDPNFTWAGTYDQTELAEGVYFWLAWYSDICGNDKEENGVVHIVK